MAKCSDLARPFGTLPAGSAVREKSRFALYSARGADDAAPRRGLPEVVLAVLRALRFAVDRSVPEAVEAAERLVAAFAPRLARLAGFFPVARFLVPDGGPARLVAMSPIFARSMPST